MPDPANAANPRKTIAGRRAGSAFVARIEFRSTIDQIGELAGTEPADTFLAPGFVDLQVNGFAGVDYNDPTVRHEAVAASIERLFQTGVTRFFPTIITGSRERMTRALGRLAEAKREFRRSGMPAAEAMAGFHVEGPHISPEDGPRGAHPAEDVRPPDFEEFQRWQDAAGGEVRLVTVSPEYPDAARYIAAVVDAGVVVGIGHTRATSEQIRAAVDAGASLSTHLGNGAHAVLHKTANYIWDQLAEDRLTASFIVDGIHLPQPFLVGALRSKGANRAVLVTDAVMPAMCRPGPYQLGAVLVELLPDGRVVVRGSTRLAGSGLSMDRAVANCVRLGGVSLETALAMATVNPARAARIAGRQRGLAAGEAADLVRFRWDESRYLVDVLETIVAGKTAYRA
jgi:N-acetylglucosamine-6-phosphate deacetylase